MATSISLVAQLLGSMTSPSQAAVKAEMTRQLEVAIEEMDPIDREVLALRHFEELTNSEVAEWLDIQQKAASIRYVRAVTRLKDILARVPGFFDSQERKP
jgi:RNA polymerase sigma-70 factor (ECF subfamily)